MNIAWLVRWVLAQPKMNVLCGWLNALEQFLLDDLRANLQVWHKVYANTNWKIIKKTFFSALFISICVLSIYGVIAGCVCVEVIIHPIIVHNMYKMRVSRTLKNIHTHHETAATNSSLIMNKVLATLVGHAISSSSTLISIISFDLHNFFRSTFSPHSLFVVLNNCSLRKVCKLFDCSAIEQFDYHLYVSASHNNSFICWNLNEWAHTHEHKDRAKNKVLLLHSMKIAEKFNMTF